MKKIILIVFIFLAGCTTGKYQQQNANGELIASNTEYPSIDITATHTPMPTIDYESTIAVAQQAVDIAQATADEARRVNAMATVEWVQAVNEQVAFTAQSNMMTHEVEMWTATAANLYVPMTATQQVINNTQIPAQQAIIAARLTSTIEAPTQLVAMIQAQNYQQYGKLDYIVRMFFMSAIGVFVIGTVIFMLRQPVSHKSVTQPVPQEPQQPATVIMHKQDRGGGNYSLKRYSVPCTPDQLSELAEKLTQGEKTLAINAWEGRDTSFTRDVILRVRAWLRDDNAHGGIEFVTPTDDGQLAPTGELFDFLCGWLETRKLPIEYEFLSENDAKSVDNNMEGLRMPDKPFISHANIR